MRPGLHALAWLLVAAASPLAAAPAGLLLEAESFADPGGWSIDTQFIDIMGSSYLLAHGLGEPVKDATTAATFPAAGRYRVWARTKDWVARWKAPGAPGKFQVVVDGKPLAAVFGAEGAEWHWQDGGTVEVAATSAVVSLRDLTGFDGRCDAIWFAKDGGGRPPEEPKALAAWRREQLGLPDKPDEAGTFDLVVAGGGIAGTAAAVSAARLGCSVALIQDRFVLGGNGSSEVRVWPQGKTRIGLFPRLGEIVEEISGHPKESPGKAEEFADATKEAVVKAEPKIALFLGHSARRVEMQGGRIASVTALEVKTGRERRFAGRLFADCTGHGSIGALAGANLTVMKEGHMGMSNMWRWADTGSPSAFPATPWALDLEMGDFPYPGKGKGEWFWETGFDRDPLADLEYMRDWNFRAVFGAFHAMKNKDGKEKHAGARLEWVAYVGGTRESRQILGDVVLTKDDIASKAAYPDGCVPTTWDIDLHYPQEKYQKKFPDDPFISRAQFDRKVDKAQGYPVPYRCFYSRNVPNLFTAGRDISVTHEALGTVRVMKTGGMMGEVVGKAASICTKYACAPREVYAKHLDELKALMQLPGKARRATVKDEPVAPAGAEAAPAPAAAPAAGGTAPASLPGIVVDDAQAKRTGSWQSGTGLPGYVGEDYRYDNRKGDATARFEFRVPKDGRYDVRLAYRPHENRATNAPVAIETAEGEKAAIVNQKKDPPLPGGFVSLGAFRFEAGKAGAVVVSNKGADGHVCIDAVQVVPAE
jgi:hypothetical protein